ncbi:MAG: hypothetical protein WCO23_02565 [bacterium]
MTQLHKRFSTDQIKMILNLYIMKKMELSEVLSQLGIKKRQFQSILAEYKKDKVNFSIEYSRNLPNRKLDDDIEFLIMEELEKEKLLINNRAIPINEYNYSAIRDTIDSAIGKRLAVQTIINKAKAWDYYIKDKPKKRLHDREVFTDAIGMLMQYDSSHHLWSPFADKKWTLITNLDDHSRKMLFGDFFEFETVWSHIQALEAVTLKYGVGLSYYTDNHAIFRFCCNRDSIWVNQIKGTDDVVTQWRQVVEDCGMKVIYALSPQAKGKIERPYRWLQDRIVRRCAKGGVKNINDAKEILADEIYQYNNKRVHSTINEIPEIRFQRAIDEGRNMFKPFQLAEPFQSTKDIFCLRDQRRVNGYGQISWQGKVLKVHKNIPVGAIVDLKSIPEEPTPELRLWHDNKLKQIFRFVK